MAEKNLADLEAVGERYCLYGRRNRTQENVYGLVVHKIIFFLNERP